MSALAPLYVGWMMIVGVLCMACCLYIAYLGVLMVMEKFGPEGLGYLTGAVLVAIAGYWIHREGAEERNASAFIVAWYEASNDYPDGRFENPDMPDLLLVDQVGHIDGYFPQRFRLLSKGMISYVGKETVSCVGGDRLSTKVYSVRCKIFIEKENQWANIKVWVDRKSNLVCKFTLQGIDIGGMSQALRDGLPEEAARALYVDPVP